MLNISSVLSCVRPDVALRWEQRIAVGDNGCWMWSSCSTNGYGRLQLHKDNKRKNYLAHRLFFILGRGWIPPGKDIDHLCKNRGCCNPDHLEIVTRRENLRRGRNANIEKTHCPLGHEYRTVGERGRKRYCYACQRIRQSATGY